MVLRIFTSAILLFSLSSAFAKDSAVTALLKQIERPTIAQLRAINTEELEAFLGEELADTAQDRAAFRLYTQIIAELTETPTDLEVYIFARDGEGLYDAIEVAAPAAVADRVTLLPVSRPVAHNPDSTLVIKALTKMGMPVNEIINGTKKVMFLDTGSRGSIYIHLLRHFFTTLTGPTRPERIKDILNRVDLRLMAARSTEQSAHFRQYVNEGGDVSQENIHSLMLSMLYFPQFPVQERKVIGIPEDDKGKWGWITTNVEYLPKWDGRVTAINEDGSLVRTIEERESTRINKVEYLKHQIRLLRHFAKKAGSPLKLAAAPAPPAKFVLADYLNKAAVTDVIYNIRYTENKEVNVKILAALADTSEGRKLLLEQFTDNKSFAHVISRYGEQFPIYFLKFYRARLGKIDRTVSIEKAYARCSVLLEAK